MKNVWTSPDLTIGIKIRIFNNTLKLVLLYRAEARRTTVATLEKIPTFFNTLDESLGSDGLRSSATVTSGIGTY